MKQILRWLNYTPLAERDPWELERSVVEPVETPTAVWLRII